MTVICAELGLSRVRMRDCGSGSNLIFRLAASIDFQGVIGPAQGWTSIRGY